MNHEEIEEKIVHTLQGKAEVSVLELYAYALKTSIETLERAFKSDSGVKVELTKAMLGKENSLPEAFEGWKSGQQHAEDA